MTPLHIRQSQTGDEEAIQNVTLAAYEEFSTTMPQHWEFYKNSIIKTLADIKSAHQLVAEQDGAIVGTVLLYPIGTEWTDSKNNPIRLDAPEIRLLAVAPATRGQGVGQALVEACMHHARESGTPSITLHTTFLMEAAMRLYERMGFIHEPELDFHPSKDFVIKGYRFRFDVP